MPWNGSFQCKALSFRNSWIHWLHVDIKYSYTLFYYFDSLNNTFEMVCVKGNVSFVP